MSWRTLRAHLGATKMGSRSVGPMLGRGLGRCRPRSGELRALEVLHHVVDDVGVYGAGTCFGAAPGVRAAFLAV